MGMELDMFSAIRDYRGGDDVITVSATVATRDSTEEGPLQI